ncbi:hypothetical protein PF005_g20356 [Phytophthora fragariae]|uniref:RxLR effector protein n=1 Tax=Phytophthora fragariae TaxID=53985 RepID=A0A6A3EGB6_9STRA|nr:hypothetical protein PF009_g18620 [Phytophthora fragariae]KAE9094532.1 hypothetical protein PF007_g17728 [Phytophthora fragariae]KAE9114691.1 hypothetical protein PF006_g19456 [Phytophthora fragariae]KAE9187676.1 hypothetical protein PF005_g20356 [Phytophthora fragariae]KAE9218111.1 hypothetical protein PF002_g16594 [Phytophthora fragariae]
MKTFAYAVAAAVACLATQTAAYDETTVLGDCQAPDPRLGPVPIFVSERVGLLVRPAHGLPHRGSSPAHVPDVGLLLARH